MNEKRDVLIQIKTYSETKELLEGIKFIEKKSFTEIIEEMIKFYYWLTYYTTEKAFRDNTSFKNGEVRVLLEKYFDVKEMQRGLLITEKTK